MERWQTMSGAAAAYGDGMATTGMSARRAILAAGIGNVLEYYDFGIYGFLATVIARKFFPGTDATAALLATFAAFGVGFLARPVGGIVLGRLGDIAGRKSALVLTIVLMAVGTAGIGLIPEYAAIGVIAPVLLVLCRILQGLSAGGEWGNATAFIVEWSPDGKRGYLGSYSQASVVGGVLVASGVAALLHSVFSDAAIDAWAWRLPFLVGAVLLPVGLWLRLGIEETPRFRAEQAGHTSGLADLGTPFGMMAKAFGFTILWTVAYYVMLTYLPTFTQKYAGLSPTAALWSNTVALVVLAAAIPVMGALSDRIGRKPLLLFCCIGFVVLAYPGFLLMLSGLPFYGVALVQIGFNLVISTFSGPGPAALVELFPTRSRTSLMSVSYALAVAIFGGFAPFIATWLIQATGTPIAPTYYLIVSGLVSAATIFTFKETAFERLR
jgi:MHS family proline/betaine transporter-like MFS transporter